MKIITFEIIFCFCFSILTSRIITAAQGQNCTNVSHIFSETVTDELGIHLQFNGTETPINNLTEKEELLRKLNETENHLYQLEWKIILKQRIDNYEAQFDEVELAKEEPIFRVNETLIKRVQVSADYDRLAERRTQKWLFYLQHPTVWASFQNLVQRVNASDKFTPEEFCRSLAILYKRISHDILVEAMRFVNHVDHSVSSFYYAEFHFVIGLILEDQDIPLTPPMWKVLHELEIFDHDEIWWRM